MEINEYDFEDLNLGMIFQFEKILTEEDLINFGKITGDKNPLHNDKEYALQKGFEDKVVYGMLAGSLFSTLLGMMCPGKKNLYLSQDLKFMNPVYPNKKLIIRGKIENKIDCIKVIEIKTEIISEDIILVDGIARVKVI